MSIYWAFSLASKELSNEVTAEELYKRAQAHAPDKYTYGKVHYPFVLKDTKLDKKKFVADKSLAHKPYTILFEITGGLD